LRPGLANAALTFKINTIDVGRPDSTASAIISKGYVAPEYREKYERMQKLHRKAFSGDAVDEGALKAAAELASELMPILHFRVDDIEWDA
jgi:hypothetical protein